MFVNRMNGVGAALQHKHLASQASLPAFQEELPLRYEHCKPSDFSLQSSWLLLDMVLGSYRETKSNSKEPGPSLALTVGPWCSPVKHSSLHRTSSSDKATLWPWGSKTKQDYFIIMARPRQKEEHWLNQINHQSCPLSWLMCVAAVSLLFIALDISFLLVF